jgi:adenylate cyclase
VRAELERILASRCFEQAARSSDFLRFVVEQTLAGQGGRLKGYTIGIEVFGRPPDFDAQADPLVRVEAGRLRRRLADYYAEEGSTDPVRIDLPRGSYCVTSTYHPPPAEVSQGPMPSVPDERNSARNRRRWRRVRSVLIAAVVLAGLGVVTLQQLEMRRLTSESAPVEAHARVFGKPPLVVLPFEDLGGEPGIGELARTLREELLLLLDHAELVVVATRPGGGGAGIANAPPGNDSDGYVLSGSARAADGHLRLTARLTEAAAGTQIWSAAYEEPLAALREPRQQRALARRIAAVAEPYGPIFEAEMERARTVPVADLTVPDCVLKYYEFRRVLDRERHADALACAERAVAREPGSAEAWALLSLLSSERYARGYFDRHGAAPIESAREAARRALDIDGNNLHGNLALLNAQYFGGENFRGVAKRVLTTWPDNGEVQAFIGTMLVLAGDTAHGRQLVERAIASIERPPSGYHATLALAALREGSYEEALAAALRIDSPDWPSGHLVTAAAAALSGRAELAARARARALELDPSIETSLRASIERWQMDPALGAELERGFAAAAGGH